MARVRRKFSIEFKREAVRQVVELGRPVSQVARELDLRATLLSRWRSELVAAGVFSGDSTDREEELSRLRRENARLRQEQEFLGKAVAYFARGSGRGTL